MRQNANNSLFDQAKSHIMSFFRATEELRFLLSEKNILPEIKYRELRQNSLYNTNIFTITPGFPVIQKYQYLKYKLLNNQ